MTRATHPSPKAGRLDTAYRAVWRWHFYAGLLSLPVLLWLAITGSMYLYKPEIERTVYGQWLTTDVRQPVMPLDPMIARVERASGAKVVQVARPAQRAEAWRMTIVRPDGERRTAFVDPHDGVVRGTVPHGGVMQVVRSLHSLIITGPVGNAVIEIVAGWTIILVLTGIWLWWPRGGRPALALRGRPRDRSFWRDLHASTGIVAGAVVLFLAVTGMPWSGTWGAGLQAIVAGQGLGRPKSPGPAPWEQHKSDHHGVALASLPWSMQAAASPRSGEGRITAGEALDIAKRRGVAAPWTLTLPSTAGQPFLVSVGVVRAQDARVIYIDAGRGRVLQDARYAQFGSAAKAIEWGIATHQGQQYGEVNRLVMLGGCIAIVLLSISAPVMWWKRRPRGRIAAPHGREGRGLLAMMVVAGIVFPLTGATMLGAALVSGARTWMRRRAAA